MATGVGGKAGANRHEQIIWVWAQSYFRCTISLVGGGGIFYSLFLLFLCETNAKVWLHSHHWDSCSLWFLWSINHISKEALGFYFILCLDSYSLHSFIFFSSVGVAARWWPVAACWSPTSRRKMQDSTPAWPPTALTTALSTPRPSSLCKVQCCCSCGCLYDKGCYIGCLGEIIIVLMHNGPSFNVCFGKGSNRMSLVSFMATHGRNFRGMPWMTMESRPTFLFRTTGIIIEQ